MVMHAPPWRLWPDSKQCLGPSSGVRDSTEVLHGSISSPPHSACGWSDAADSGDEQAECDCDCTAHGRSAPLMKACVADLHDDARSDAASAGSVCAPRVHAETAAHLWRGREGRSNAPGAQRRTVSPAPRFEAVHLPASTPERVTRMASLLADAPVMPRPLWLLHAQAAGFADAATRSEASLVCQLQTSEAAASRAHQATSLRAQVLADGCRLAVAFPPSAVVCIPPQAACSKQARGASTSPRPAAERWSSTDCAACELETPETPAPNACTCSALAQDQAQAPAVRKPAASCAISCAASEAAHDSGGAGREEGSSEHSNVSTPRAELLQPPARGLQDELSGVLALLQALQDARVLPPSEPSPPARSLCGALDACELPRAAARGSDSVGAPAEAARPRVADSDAATSIQGKAPAPDSAALALGVLLGAALSRNVAPPSDAARLLRETETQTSEVPAQATGTQTSGGAGSQQAATQTPTRVAHAAMTQTPTPMAATAAQTSPQLQDAGTQPSVCERGHAATQTSTDEPRETRDACCDAVRWSRPSATVLKPRVKHAGGRVVLKLAASGEVSVTTSGGASLVVLLAPTSAAEHAALDLQSALQSRLASYRGPPKSVRSLDLSDLLRP